MLFSVFCEQTRAIKSIRGNIFWHESAKRMFALLMSLSNCTTFLCVFFLHFLGTCLLFVFVKLCKGLFCFFDWLGRRCLLCGFRWGDRMFPSNSGMLQLLCITVAHVTCFSLKSDVFRLWLVLLL